MKREGGRVVTVFVLEDCYFSVRLVDVEAAESEPLRVVRRVLELRLLFFGRRGEAHLDVQNAGELVLLRHVLQLYVP